MLAWLLKLTTIGAAALVVTWVWRCLLAGRWLAALAGALVVAGAHAVVLGIEFGLLSRLRDGSTPPASVRQLLHAWCGEVGAAAVVFCWRQPFRSRRWPDRLPSGAGGCRGVVLIHGFVCNRGVWNRWLERLTHDGVPVIAVDLEPVFGQIDDYVTRVEAAIRRIEQCTGLAPIVVAHSMGGLALRRWWIEPGNGERVHHAVTIGTPHRGAWLARFGTTSAARQMRIGSQWLQALAAAEPPDRGSRCTCFFGHCDNIVFPASSGALPGADNRHIEAVAHLRMIDHDAPWNELQRLLTIDAVARTAVRVGAVDPGVKPA